MILGGIQIADEPFTALCREYSVRSLSVFGSRSRGDNRPDSDIDLLVEFIPESRTDLIEFIQLKHKLQDLLGINVDLVSRGGLKPRMQERVLSEARSVYAI